MTKMDNETRLNIQYEIFQFLLNNYYSDDGFAGEGARRDSYCIMKIIENGLRSAESIKTVIMYSGDRHD